jgi:Xaa-Pro dipeptidase
MQTMQPTLKRGRDVWDRINMPKAEFLERVRKIKKDMQQKGMDVLLLYGNSLNEYGDPCYVSNYVMKMPQGAMVVITRSGEVTLICEGFSRDLPEVKNATWVENVISCENVSQRSVAFLKEKSLIPSTLGLVGLERFMPYDQFQFFSKSIGPCKMMHADDMIREMRMIKSEREVDQIRRASRIVSRIFDKVSHTLFSNIDEKGLEAVMGREAYLDGAEDVRMLIAKPQEKNWALRPLGDIPFSVNDTVILYLAVEFERYWAEGIRTGVFGRDSFTEPPADHFNTLYNQIIQNVKIGKRISQFYKETLTEIKATHQDAIHEYGLGQGIGLSLHEFPLLTEGETNPLREGMCLTLRLAIKNGRKGPMMIGNTIYLSKAGPEVLTQA